MQIGRVLHTTKRSQWREWLAKHYRTESEVWLQFYKKGSGQSRLSYNDAVEEALCFGWIDSIVKAYDKDSFVQRFTPRKSTNITYSQLNKERLIKLIKNKQVMPEVLENIQRLKLDKFEFPKDIIAAIRKDKDAWKHYQNFSDSYKRIRVAFIDGARSRPEEFKRRLANFIRMSAQNKKIGIVGSEEYY